MAFAQPPATLSSAQRAPLRQRVSARLRTLLVALARYPGQLHHQGAIRRQRRALGRLDARLLDDIGVTPAEAEAEARRPAWDAPRHWRN